ncbi:MAG: protein kinase [Planctomycetes bacterium]|nr:protein kinase [Planctomycetota bacterium]
MDGFELSIEQVSRCLSEYEVLRVVGQGAMGVVYEATHRPLQRRVALKVLPPGLAVRETTILRFLREAEVVARIQHENIVPIYDVGSRSGLHYIAMRFVPGVSLDRAVAAAPLSPREVAQIGAAVARALACAHGHGVVHRDVKPANILREPDGRVVLTDFGLARVDGSGSMTESGALVGTPSYMSPEQVSGERDSVDGRSDLYSLGATLFELLTGKPPHQESTTAATLRSILERPTPRVRRLRPDCPPELEVILDKAMRKDPGGRYANATALGEDLERFLEGKPILGRREAWWLRAGRFVSNHRGVFIAAAIAAALGVGAMFALDLAGRRTGDMLIAEAYAAMDEARPAPGASPESSDSVKKVLSLLDKAHQVRSTRLRACYARAEFYLRLGLTPFLTSAMADTAEILASDPENLDALLLRGRVAFKLGEFDESGSCAKRAQAIAPSDPRVLTLAARLVAELGKSYDSEGLISEARSQWTLARDWLRTALENDSKFSEAALELGTVYLLLGDRASAREWFDKAIALDPKSGEAHHRLAKFEEEGGDTRAANMQAEFAHALNPFLSISRTSPNLTDELSRSVGRFAESFRTVLDRPTSKPAASQPKPLRPL